MRKLNASIVIGIIVAIIGAASVVAYGRTIDQRVVRGRQAETVLVADDTLASGTPVSALEGRVHAVQMPAAFVVDQAVASLSSVPSGKVLTSAVPKGGQLSLDGFANPGAAGQLAPAPGDIAIAVQTDVPPGVARYLGTGQLVDVFVTYQDVRSGSGSSSFAASRTKLFLTGAKVLAVNAATNGPAAKAGKGLFGGGSTSSAQPTDKVLVVLDLSPTQGERLVNAETLGTIYLAYTAEGGDRTPTGVTPDDVVRSNR